MDNTAHTGTNAAFGLLLSVTLCVVLAGIVSIKPTTRLAVYFVGVFFQVSPAVAYIPVFILVFGIGETVKILTSALICFYPLLVSVLEAFHEFPARLNALALVYDAPMWRRVQIYGWAYILLALCRGLISAAPLSVVGSIVADYVAGGTRPGGLGELIQTAGSSENWWLLVQGIAAATALGFTGFLGAYCLKRAVQTQLTLDRE